MGASYSVKDGFVQKIITCPGKTNSSRKAASCRFSGWSQFRPHHDSTGFVANCGGCSLYLSKFILLAAIPGSMQKT
jgi:hypothetical protein